MNEKKTGKKPLQPGSEGSMAILMSLLVLTVILVISLSISRIVNSGLEMGVTQVFSVKAFFASEAGIEHYLWEIRKSGVDPVALGCPTPSYVCFDGSGAISGCAISTSSCGSSVYQQSFSNGSIYYLTYQENYDAATAATTTIIVSHGDYKDNRRMTRVEY